ncbi:UDP-glucose 4-epimerase GalE [Yunchengibacter salinarum]|uniref:UDP-glucose 4-epimerase GalE n=1 Tax=Yunchengibacter salinarum TaxID=3133399 RepID=UPI0035B5BD69
MSWTLKQQVGEGRVLVTGGAGYIGGQTVLALMDAGVPVAVVDDFSTGVEADFLSDVPVLRARVQDSDRLSAFMKRENVVAVLHFAGSIRVDESLENPLKYYENNLLGTMATLRAAVDAGVRACVLSSTAAVYGEPDSPVVNEDTPTRPINPYGQSKLQAEACLFDAGRASDLAVGAFRYFNVAGADKEQRHGQWQAVPKHLLGRALAAGLDLAPPLDIFGDDFPTPDGTGVRDYIHVMDVADAHLALLADLLKTGAPRLFNLGYGAGTSVREAVDAVGTLLGRAVPHRVVARRAGDPASVIADPGALSAALGWQGRHRGLDGILSDSLSWLKASGLAAGYCDGEHGARQNNADSTLKSHA